MESKILPSRLEGKKNRIQKSAGISFLLQNAVAPALSLATVLSLMTSEERAEMCVSLVDKVSLMKEFSHRRSELKGQALLDVTEHLSGMASPCKPRGLPRQNLQGMPVNRQ